MTFLVGHFPKVSAVFGVFLWILESLAQSLWAHSSVHIGWHAAR